MYKENFCTYTYIFGGDFWAPMNLGKDGKYHDSGDNYIIEVSMPTKYKSKKAAKEDRSFIQFRNLEGHIVLIIWSGWEQGKDNTGKWYEHNSGEVLDIIHWQDWTRYKIAKQKTEAKDKCCNTDTDYIPDATPWDELFGVENLPADWCCNVESLYYSIISNINN